MDNKIKELIEASTQDGIINDDERAYIVKRAAELGIDEVEVNIYINASLKTKKEPITKTVEKERTENAPVAWLKFSEFEIGNWILLASAILAFFSGFFPWVESHVSSSGFGQSMGDSGSIGGGVIYSFPLGVAAFVCAMQKRYSKYRLYTGLSILFVSIALLVSYSSSTSSHISSDYGSISGRASTNAGPGVVLLMFAGILYTLGAVILLDKEKKIVRFLKSEYALLAYLFLLIIIPISFKYRFDLVEAIFALAFWSVLPYFLAKKQDFKRTQSVLLGNFALWGLALLLPKYGSATYIKYTLSAYETVIKYYLYFFTIIATLALVQDYLESKNKKIDLIDNFKTFFNSKIISSILLLPFILLSLFYIITKHEITQEEWKSFVENNNKCEGAWYFINNDSSDVESIYINFDYGQEGESGGVKIEYSASLNQISDIELKKTDPTVSLSVDYKYLPSFPIDFEEVLKVTSIEGKTLQGVLKDIKGKERKIVAKSESETLRTVINKIRERKENETNLEQQESEMVPMEENISVNTPGKYPEASQRLLTISEVKDISKIDLKIMRNEIFARHGFIFKTADMKSYFEKQSWYTPKSLDVTNELTTIEKENINLIKKHE